MPGRPIHDVKDLWSNSLGGALVPGTDAPEQSGIPKDSGPSTSDPGE